MAPVILLEAALISFQISGINHQPKIVLLLQVTEDVIFCCKVSFLWHCSVQLKCQNFADNIYLANLYHPVQYSNLGSIVLCLHWTELRCCIHLRRKVCWPRAGCLFWELAPACCFQILFGVPNCVLHVLGWAHAPTVNSIWHCHLSEFSTKVNI